MIYYYEVWDEEGNYPVFTTGFLNLKDAVCSAKTFALDSHYDEVLSVQEVIISVEDNKVITNRAKILKITRDIVETSDNCTFEEHYV